MSQALMTLPSEWIRLAEDFDPNAHLMQIKGKDYLDVQNRLIWFIRDQRQLIAAGCAKATYTITTELTSETEGWAEFKTTVRDVLGNEATMYGSESVRDFSDYREKASTKSLGRALLMLGYGTRFAPEMSLGEEDRPVDAPTKPKATLSPAQTAKPSPKGKEPTLEALQATIKQMCKQHGISGKALDAWMNWQSNRYSSSTYAHLQEIVKRFTQPQTLAELHMQDLAMKHLLAPEVLFAIMRRRSGNGLQSYENAWAAYDISPERRLEWDDVITEEKKAKAVA